MFGLGRRVVRLLGDLPPANHFDVSRPTGRLRLGAAGFVLVRQDHSSRAQVGRILTGCEEDPIKPPPQYTPEHIRNSHSILVPLIAPTIRRVYVRAFRSVAPMKPSTRVTKVSSKAEEPQVIPVKLEFRTPPSIATRVANHVIVQADHSGWFLSFFEAIPPMMLGSKEDVIKQLEAIQSVPAECVARIFLPGNRAQDFVNAIQNVAQQLASSASRGDKP